jgi:deaminated glutathione amidase
VLLHPVMTTTIDRDVELAITRATAAMFQCYVIDVNGLGDGGVGRSCIVDPAGTLLHQAGGQEELFPIEVDLRAVRRQREVGLHGLGQPLKSFRDRSVEFPVYDRASGADAYLHTLGPLEMPKRGSRAGLDAPPPGQRTAPAAPFVERPAAPDLVAARAPLPDVEPP